MNKKGSSQAIWIVVVSILVVLFIFIMINLLDKKVKPALMSDEDINFFESNTIRDIFSKINFFEIHNVIKREVIKDVRSIITKYIS